MTNYGLNLPKRKAIVVHLWLWSNLFSLVILAPLVMMLGVVIESLYAVMIFIVLQHWSTWALRRWLYNRREHDAAKSPS